jgi:SAM-dependent methyltransferase
MKSGAVQSVLDLGCGAGEFSSWLVHQGASEVTGVDVSERMLRLAQSRRESAITFIRSSVEDVRFPTTSFDLVVSSLMLHYVEDLGRLFMTIRTWLRPGGSFVFSIEHPILTAAQGMPTQWERDAQGNKVSWRVDRYSYEGIRTSRWLNIDSVVKYHRTAASILNSLIDADFRIRRVLEPHATEAGERERPELLDERRRPLFLLVASRVANRSAGSDESSW